MGFIILHCTFEVTVVENVRSVSKCMLFICRWTSSYFSNIFWTIFFSSVLTLLSCQKWVEVISVSLLGSLFCCIHLYGVWRRMSHTGSDICVLGLQMVQLFREVVHSCWRKYITGFRHWDFAASSYFHITPSASWSQLNIWFLSFLLWPPDAMFSYTTYGLPSWTISQSKLFLL